ncbi:MULTISPECIES: hypothetical protein [Sinorhizobium]|nr:MULTISPECIES: hypothetical protein [Sinorhizobium]
MKVIAGAPAAEDFALKPLDGIVTAEASTPTPDRNPGLRLATES